MTNHEKQRIMGLLNKILNKSLTDSQEIAIYEELSRLIPDPRWSNYIFWSDDYLNEDESINFEKFLDKVNDYTNTDEYIRNRRVIELIDKLLKKDFQQMTESEMVNEINKLSSDPNWANYIFVEKSCLNEDGTINDEKFIRKLFPL